MHPFFLQGEEMEPIAFSLNIVGLMYIPWVVVVINLGIFGILANVQKEPDRRDRLI